MRILCVLAAALTPGTAHAVDLGKLLNEPVVKTLTSDKSFEAVERCVFLMDKADLPTLYRSPDNSLIFWTGGVVEITKKDGKTAVLLRNPRLEKKTRACL